jgi:multidrug transporter EmrE-like cation transporter
MEITPEGATMNLYVLWNMLVFYGMQIAAALLFKWGTTKPGLWWWGFVLGNAFGMPSIYFLMNIYKCVNPSVTAAMCTGGSFMLTQIAMALVFQSRLNWVQYLGVAAILGGILLITLGERAPIE